MDPELGLLLAAEAARLSQSPRTEDILRRALLVSHLRRVLPERRVTAASLVGNRILVGSADGIVRAYTGDARRRLTTLAVGRPVTGVAANSDGRFALTTERGGPARLWDAAGGEALRSFGRAPVSASLSPRRWKPVRRADIIALSQSLFASETVGRNGTSRRASTCTTPRLAASP